MSTEWMLLGLRLLAVVVLYAFLIAAVFVVWRELRSLAPATPGQAAPESEAELAARLRVSAARMNPDEEDHAIAASTTFPLSTPLSVGRAPDNGIVLTDDGVSQHHAWFECRDGEWWICDLGSRNGTFLNGIQIARPQPMAHGDVITLGRLTLTFEADERVLADGQSPLPRS